MINFHIFSYLLSSHYRCCLLLQKVKEKEDDYSISHLRASCCSFPVLRNSGWLVSASQPGPRTVGVSCPFFSNSSPSFFKLDGRGGVAHGLPAGHICHVVSGQELKACAAASASHSLTHPPPPTPNSVALAKLRQLSPLSLPRYFAPKKEENNPSMAASPVYTRAINYTWCRHAIIVIQASRLGGGWRRSEVRVRKGYSVGSSSLVLKHSKNGRPMSLSGEHHATGHLARLTSHDVACDRRRLGRLSSASLVVTAMFIVT